MNHDLLAEINRLWGPIQPYLARQIEELYGRPDGSILEIGPFSGLIFALARKKVGQDFLIAAFPEGAARLCRQEAQRLGLEQRVRIIESNSSLRGVPDGSIDLAIFRGALFFPSLFQADFQAVDRSLRAGGIAFVGGGYGKYAPPEIIQRIGKRSEELNAALGKIRINDESLKGQLQSAHLKSKTEITTEGGLWVVMRK